MPRRATAKETPDAPIAHRRILFVAIGLVLWMLVIGGRLVQLQIYRNSELASRARKQQLSSIETAPTRGQVLDRQGRELARSLDTESFYSDPSEVTNVEATARKIASITGLDRAELVKKFNDAKAANKKFIWLIRRLEMERASKLDALELDGVYSRKEPKRYYPNDTLAAHVLGFVSADEIGLGGVEQAYNEKISGEKGKVYFEHGRDRRAFESYEVRSHPGQTIVLTIDQLIQYRTERALTAAVERSRAKSGTAIVMDPRTGEILALANAPTFNPNNPTTVTAEDRTNIAVQNIYEPGSTFKIVAFAAAIEQGLVKPDDKIDCQMGSITIAGRVVNDHKPFGVLTITDALGQSSDVAAIKLGLLVGNETMYDYMKRFGFGSRTGVDLNGESPGILKTVNRWQASSIGSLAMGQEIGVTPLQMAAAYVALANGGTWIKPHVVRELRMPDGTVVYQAKPETRKALNPETAAALRGMFEYVTLHGTAKKAQIEGYTAAGKTGTAQKIDTQTGAYSATNFIASFAGFAPVNNPSVVIIVVIDSPMGAYHGGDVAAPIFREIAEQVLPELNVTPDTEVKSIPSLIAGVSKPSPRQMKEEAAQVERRQETLPKVVASKSFAGRTSEVVFAMATNRGVLMPDLRGQSVRDALRMCAQLGLKLEARGDGFATGQYPAAGTEIDTGQRVRVDFARRN